MKTLGSLMQLCRRTVAGWWSVDRIRITPAAGRLLQLNVGDSVLISHELYEVISRQVSSVCVGADVQYTLQGDRCEKILHARRKPDDPRVAGELIDDSGRVAVFDDDVTPVPMSRRN